MSEEEIIKQVDFIIKWISKIGLIKEREAIKGLLDLYNKEKEKNKELEEKNFYLPAWVTKKYISKDKIKEKIERKISCCRTEELEDNYIDDKHSQYWKMFREFLEKLEQELLEEGE